MIVMMIAITPSLNASSRPLVIASCVGAEPRSARQYNLAAGTRDKLTRVARRPMVNLKVTTTIVLATIAIAAAAAAQDQPPAPPPLAPVRVGGTIRQPTKLVDVRPVYPAIAQSARIQGVVILEVTIAPDGAVADAKILRSIPLLDDAAVE